MSRRWPLAAVALGASVVAGSVFASVIIGYQEANVQAKRLTPVIFVEEVRPCLAFWTDVLGFEVTGEVPEGEGDGLAYASVGSGTLELMYQTYAGVEEDLPAMAGRATGNWGILYVEVADLDALKPKLVALEIFQPERTTFYGAREIGLRAPCGTPVVLAEFEQDEEG